MKEEKKVEVQHGSIKSYIFGFFLSLILTLIAFTLTFIHVTSYHETIPHEVLIPSIFLLAFIQLGVQLTFFLHIWKGKSPKWNLLFFLSTFGLVLLVVIMSLWIMQHLNYNMTPSEMTKFLIQDEGIH